LPIPVNTSGTDIDSNEISRVTISDTFGNNAISESGKKSESQVFLQQDTVTQVTEVMKHSDYVKTNSYKESGSHSYPTVTSDSESDSENEFMENDANFVTNLKTFNESALSDDSDEEESVGIEVSNTSSKESPSNAETNNFKEASLSDDSDDENNGKTQLIDDDIYQGSRSISEDNVNDDDSDSEEEDYDVVDYDDASNDEMKNSHLVKITTTSPPMPRNVDDSIPANLDDLDDDEDDDDDDDDDAELDEEINSLYNDIDTIMNKPKGTAAAPAPSRTLPEALSTSMQDKNMSVSSSETSFSKSSHFLADSTPDNVNAKKAKLVDDSVQAELVNKSHSDINNSDNIFLNRKRAAPAQEIAIENKKQKVGDNAIRCHMCQSNKTMKCYDFLQHLSTHYSKDLFSRYPLNEGESCSVCLEDGRGRRYQLTKNGKSNYIAHIGKVHLRVLELVKPELQEQLVNMLKKYEKKGEEYFTFLQKSGGDFEISGNNYNRQQATVYDDQQAPSYSEQSSSDYNSQKEYGYHSQPVQENFHAFNGQPDTVYDGESSVDYNSQHTQDYKRDGIQEYSSSQPSQAYGYESAQFYAGHSDFRSQSVPDYNIPLTEAYHSQQASSFSSSIFQEYNASHSNSDYDGSSQTNLGNPVAFNYNQLSSSHAAYSDLKNSEPYQLSSSLEKHRKCLLCEDEKQYTRGSLLNHLTVGHFYKQLSSLIGNNFTVDNPCEFCVRENKYPPIIIKNKNNYVRHVGTVHEKVLQFSPPAMLELVNAMANKGKPSIQNRKGEIEDLPGPSNGSRDIKNERIINLPDGLSVITSSNPHQKQFPTIPSGLKITKSKKIFEGADVLDQMKNIGSNLKIERVTRDTSTNFPTLLPCGECDYKAENKFNMGLHMRTIHQRAAGRV